LAAAHFVDRPAPGQGHDPAERLALLLMVGGRAVPEFDENLLQEIIHVMIVMHDPADYRAKQWRVSAVECR